MCGSSRDVAEVIEIELKHICQPLEYAVTSRFYDSCFLSDSAGAAFTTTTAQHARQDTDRYPRI